MSFRTKLLYVFEKYNLNPTSLSKRLNYASAEKIARLTRHGNNRPSYELIRDIVIEFKDINPRWWFSEEAHSELDEPRVQYGFCKECLKKEGVIEHLKKELALKDKRIEELIKEAERQTDSKKEAS
jgi:hypothetical protein